MTAALPCSALVWLRRLIELGLREEAAEREIGPAIECPSCHEPTPPTRSAATAAPRSTPSRRPGTPTRRRRRAGARRRRRQGRRLRRARRGRDRARRRSRSLLSRPGSTTPRASRAFPCAAPPGAPVAAPHLVAGVFRSGHGAGRAAAASVCATGASWDLVKSSVERHRAAVEHRQRALRRRGRRSSQPSTPRTGSTRSQSQVSDQPDGFLGVQRDGSAAHVILSPELGFVHGVAADVLGDRRPAAEPGREGRARVRGGAGTATATVVVEAITNETAQGTSASSPFPVFQARRRAPGAR